ncbi:S41 family peptidase [Govanella unica]|uniref:S41 family peptidase n=1 Tax=Govanella unica TaxID=2975056 RepID=A0A9X3Z649_9PROT|nr:S41 family peptidase [Govania unica]MDA5192766.1 S41 family peptidase [Govania unica]
MRKFAGTASAIAVIVGLGAGLAIGLQFNPDTNSAQAASSETYRQLNLFGDVFERVRADYVEEVKDSSMIEAAIQGMLASLDPHSSYMTPDDFKNMQVQTKGEFGGLGLEVTMESGVVRVVSPIDDTPAARAGLKTGDYITYIDGEQVMGLTLTQAVDKMRGPTNTKVKLTIVREGLDASFDVELTRDIIKIQSVRSHAEGDVGYVRVTSFTEQTDAGVRKAIADLKKDIGPGLKGYVLDLRNNPGGLLDQAVAVSDDFLNQGEIVQTRGRNNRDIQRYNATRGDVTDGKTVVILINGGSASASEIVAGALQDHERALVIGTQSFGKGSVQTIIPLGANGALRLTTARYYTPSGRSIQAKGITPDVVVEQMQVPDANANRQFRNEASLRGHLENPADGKTADGKPADTKPADATAPKINPKLLPQPEAKGDGKKPENRVGSTTPAGTTAISATGLIPKDNKELVKIEDKKRTEDYQLSYALDLVRGLSTAQKRAAKP